LPGHSLETSIETVRIVGPDTRKLALVMVGLPARGKSYTARKIERYLSWLGYRTRVFNVGEYRRARVGTHMRHAFFDPDNAEGEGARKQVAMSALADMTDWLAREGQVAIYDATNSTFARRSMVRQRCETAGFQVLFIEISCDDPDIIEANIRSTKLSSPDYEKMDADEAVRDFRARIAHYERVYEPLDDRDGAFLRVSQAGGKVTASNVDGYLPARLVLFLMNLHLTDRPIWLTRHGESAYNINGLIGGDPDLSSSGQRYAKSLATFLDNAFPERDGVVIWTSSMQRAMQTAQPLNRRYISWRALDEIDAGVCDGLSYEQIHEQLPEEFARRRKDKFNYRYPRGESYHDVIQRLDPAVIELERTRKPGLVIGHNAIVRALYAYLTGVPPEQCPHLSFPLHTIVQLNPHAYGCHETRISLDPRVSGADSG
jgi:broad specificity phosphatase PhoE/adenylylsulfate kinase-like enzyme